MTSKVSRVLTAIIALLVGLGIVFVLTKLSEKTKGPLEQVLDKIENTIHDFEEKNIIKNQTKKRSDKLKWLQAYNENINDLKNPKLILLGAFDNKTTKNFKPVINLEDTLETTFPLIHIYTAWGSKPVQKFPKKAVQDIKDLGSIPVITWEPWLTAFDEKEYPQLKSITKRDKNGLIDIASGTYDFYLEIWATQAKAFGSPIFLRLAHEMNDPYRYPWGPQNNSPKDFIAAWQHIHKVFSKIGAKNIIWIWAPHPAYGHFNDYYPGSAYVDYVGIGTLNYGPVVNWSKWWTFDQIFGNHYKEFSTFKKPIMLTEFASLTYGGSRSKWYGDALKSIPIKYPLIKSLLFFHFDADNTTTQQTLNWQIINDKSVIKTIKTEINNWNDSLKVKP